MKSHFCNAKMHYTFIAFTDGFTVELKVLIFMTCPVKYWGSVSAIK